MKKLLIQYCLLFIGTLGAQASLLDRSKINMESPEAKKYLQTEKRVIAPSSFVWTHEEPAEFYSSLGEPVYGLPGTLPQIGFLNNKPTFPMRQIVAVINTPALSTVEVIKTELQQAFEQFQSEQERDERSSREKIGESLKRDDISEYANFDYFLENGRIITQYIIYGQFKTPDLKAQGSLKVQPNVNYEQQHVLYYPYVFSHLKMKKNADQAQITAGLFNPDGLKQIKNFLGYPNLEYLLFGQFIGKTIKFKEEPKTTTQDTKIAQDDKRSVACFWTVVFDAPFLKEFDKDPSYPKVMMVTCHLLTDMDVGRLGNLSAQQTLKDFLAYIEKSSRQNDDEQAFNKFVVNIEQTIKNYESMKKQEEAKKAEEKKKREEEKKKKQEEEKKKKKQEEEKNLKEAQAKYKDLVKALTKYKEFLDTIPKSA